MSVGLSLLQSQFNRWTRRRAGYTADQDCSQTDHPTARQSLLAVCRSEIASVRDPAVQQLAVEGLRQVQRQLNEASGMISQQPDSALSSIRSTQRYLNSVLADAKAAANRWSKEQAKAQARIAEVQSQVQAARSQADEQAVAQVEQRLAEAASLAQSGRPADAMRVLEGSEKLIEKAQEKVFDETVRREVVRGLLGTPSVTASDNRARIVCSGVPGLALTISTCISRTWLAPWPSTYSRIKVLIESILVPPPAERPGLVEGDWPLRIPLRATGRLPEAARE